MLPIVSIQRLLEFLWGKLHIVVFQGSKLRYLRERQEQINKVVLCTKGRVRLDNLFTRDTLFLSGSYYGKKTCSVHA